MHPSQFDNSHDSLMPVRSALVSQRKHLEEKPKSLLNPEPVSLPDKNEFVHYPTIHRLHGLCTDTHIVST